MANTSWDGYGCAACKGTGENLSNPMNAGQCEVCHGTGSHQSAANATPVPSSQVESGEHHQGIRVTRIPSRQMDAAREALINALIVRPNDERTDNARILEALKILKSSPAIGVGTVTIKIPSGYATPEDFANDCGFEICTAQASKAPAVIEADVGRIINPDAWRNEDGYEIAQEGADEALAKARDIIALIQSAAQGGGTEGGKICHCFDDVSRKFCLDKNTCTPMAVAQTRPSDPPSQEASAPEPVGYMRSHGLRAITRAGLTTIYSAKHKLDDDVPLYAHPPAGDRP